MTAERETFHPTDLIPVSYAEPVEPEEFWSEADVLEHNRLWEQAVRTGYAPMDTEEFDRYLRTG